MLENVKDLQGSTPDDELTREQLLERLEGAKLIVSSLQSRIDVSRIVHSATAVECAERGAKMQKYAVRLRAAARDLSRCGQYDHESKNEVILDVIHDLLVWADDLPVLPLAPENDDIPF